MKRLTTFLLGLSILMPFGFTLQAIDNSDISALKKIGTRWNIPFIPDYPISVSGKDGPQISLVGSVGAAVVGYKAGHWITDMIKSSPKKADEFLKEHTNVKGALEIGDTLLQNITPFPWAFRKIKESLKEYTWFESTQNLLSKPVTWGVAGGGLLAWYAYSKLYRYTKDGLIKDVNKCVKILNEYDLFNTEITYHNISTVLDQQLLDKLPIVKTCEELELVKQIIDPLVKQCKNLAAETKDAKDAHDKLNSVKTIVNFNLSQLKLKKMKKAYLKELKIKAQEQNAQAQTKIANAQNSMANTTRFYAIFNALFKTGKFFIANEYGRGIFVGGMVVVGLKKWSDSFSEWSSGIKSSS